MCIQGGGIEVMQVKVNKGFAFLYVVSVHGRLILFNLLLF
jgi:hypothetical protein